MALRSGFVLSLAGQLSTHKPQPVQSSGEIWTVNLAPGNSLNFASNDLKVSGASFNNSASHNLVRMAACGQTNAHFPH